ncbi:motility associated factor glycosyltransferase family protein [Kordiimonas aestuarii]|uniref:hypothetical protein n=1 Tax=Kordiimonas aestuarii TaxID=1005925 RepID=UPI0021D0B4C0|nr:hypothetical protein [Kordiimonas aestuarii]
MNILLLTSRPTFPACGPEQDTGQLWSALNTAASVRIFELLPHSVPVGLAMCHPFSHSILARYGDAGVLPEVLSLKKRLASEIEAENPSVICLLDASLLPLAISIRKTFARASLCLLTKDDDEATASNSALSAYSDLFDRHISFAEGQIGDAAGVILDLAGAHGSRPLHGFEQLDKHAVFNPLSRFFLARLIHWGAIKPNDLTATLCTSSGRVCDNISFDCLARDGTWTLFQVMAILPDDTQPEDTTLTIRKPKHDGVTYSAPPRADYDIVSGNILTTTRGENEGIDVLWWFHKPSISQQSSTPDSRVLEIKGRDLLINKKTFEKNAPVALHSLGCNISFPDKDVLFAGKGDAGVKSFKDIHKGKAAWFIGNGPSVRHKDLEQLSSALTFGFNRLHLAYDKTDFRPSYVLCGDEQMIIDFSEDIAQNAVAPVFFASANRPQVDAPFTWLRQLACFPSVFSPDASTYVTAGGSSVFAAMQLAFYMGVRKFYLYGTDFRFVYSRDSECDDRNRSAMGDGNHFIKNYRAGLPWSPPELRSISDSFLTADIFMRLQGGFIRNATHGGNLEIFDRVAFKDALEAEKIPE